MNKKVFTIIVTIGMVLMATPILRFNDQFAKPGLVAYSAEYSSSITEEPNYTNQYNYGIKDLNFGDIPDQYRGEGVKVAIIDSGINYSHEDFSLNQIQDNSKYYKYNYEKGKWEYYQWSTHDHSNLNDTLGHGTNVAASTAALINGVGGFGIAPNVDLYVYKVTNASNGYEFGAIQLALLDCISNGVDVINMSFQSYEHEVSYKGSTMEAASGCSTILSYYINQCYNAGITMVAAAGNYNTSEPSYPASNNHVISVGSLAEGSKTNKADYSNTYGIDLVAPGTVYVADKNNSNSYKKANGTSFSAPIVTGAIALYKQAHPSATPAQIEKALYDSCDHISGSWAGHGRLNIERFINDEASVTGISSPEDEETISLLPNGNSYQLDWKVEPETAINKEVEFEVLFEDEECLAVDENGLITTLEEGAAYISITSKDNSCFGTFITVVVSDYSPIEHVLTWANHFLNVAKGYCDYNGNNSDIDGIGYKWIMFSKEYNCMSNESKSLFFTSEDETIVEARTLYRMIVSKYQSESITDFATDGDGNYFDLIGPMQNSKEIHFEFYLTSSIVFIVGISLVSILLNNKKKNKGSNN